MFIRNHTPISYPEAITLIYETYWGKGYGILYTVLEGARERRRFSAKGTHYRITGPIGPDRDEASDFEGEQLALAL